MLSVLSLVALGALEQCVYTDLDPDTQEDCSGNVNAAQCIAVQDDDIGKCTSTTSNGWMKGSCSGSTVKLQFHAKTDCSDDTSATCVIDIIDPTRAVITGCHMTFPIDQCETYMAVMGMGVHIKYTGTCPAADDEPCFSREAEACRVLDTSVAPSVAFRACFDEPAPTVAERVKMTALTGGDYVLSAGMDQAYEFTRVIVNQHKLNEARHRHTRPPPPPLVSLLPQRLYIPPSVPALGTPCTPPPSPPTTPPPTVRAEALEHPQDRPRRWRDRAHAGPRAAGRRPVGRRAHRQGESARYPMHRESLSLVPSYPPPAPRPSLAPPRPV